MTSSSRGSLLLLLLLLLLRVVNATLNLTLHYEITEDQRPGTAIGNTHMHLCSPGIVATETHTRSHVHESHAVSNESNLLER